MSKPVLVVSAHLDDAILSCGQFIAGRGGNVDVLTVFSGIPMNEPDEDGKPFLTKYDKECGFESSKDAMVVRREEDSEACAILNANPIHLDYMDYQYQPDDGEWGKHVLDYIDDKEYEIILSPLGLRHPDHIQLSDAVVSWGLDKLYLYEDLPHRVTHPELVFERKNRIGIQQMSKPSFLGNGSMVEKLRALWCYRSQMGRGDLNIHNICVSERFWKV